MIIGVYLGANEIDRMESIVKDIQTLRIDYNKCIKELDIKNMDANNKNKEIKPSKSNEKYKNF